MSKAAISHLNVDTDGQILAASYYQLLRTGHFTHCREKYFARGGLRHDECNRDISPTSVRNTALLALYFSVLSSKAENDREQTAECNQRQEEP